MDHEGEVLMLAAEGGLRGLRLHSRDAYLKLSEAKVKFRYAVASKRGMVENLSIIVMALTLIKRLNIFIVPMCQSRV